MVEEESSTMMTTYQLPIEYPIRIGTDIEDLGAEAATSGDEAEGI